jgi:cytochrome c-type biogenesis protein CcmH/NrfG
VGEVARHAATREIARLQAEAARRDPRNAVAWALLGDDLERSGDAAGALAAFERALVEEPRCTRALQGLARRLRGVGRDDEAAELEGRARAAATLAASADGAHAREVLSPAQPSENMRDMGASEP